MGLNPFQKISTLEETIKEKERAVKKVKAEKAVEVPAIKSEETSCCSQATSCCD